MTEERDKMPELPGQVPELLKERKWFGTDTTGLLLDFTKPYSPPMWTLSHNGIPFAKLGDLHIVGGKAGHGKTAFMSQIMSALLCGHFGNMKCEIELTAHDPATGEEVKMQPTVLYIDTEQSIDDTIAIKNRVCTLSGIDYTQPSDRFFVARMRDTTKAADRYKQILQLIWDIRPTVVFIDGLLDLVSDYNDQTECSDVIRELMAVSTYYNISLWCVLHENPMTDKLVGSLGSIAERKVTEVFVIRKHKAPHDKRFQGMPNVFFEVKQTKARGKDQDDWYFAVEDRALGWGVPVEINTDGSGSIDSKEMQMMKDADTLFKAYNWKSSGATWTDLRNFALSKGLKERRFSDLLNIACEKGIVYRTDKKKYHYHGLNDIPVPTDTTDDLPFLPNKEKADF